MTSCDKECGGGKRTKTRQIKVESKNGGIECQHKKCLNVPDIENYDLPDDENCEIREEKCNLHPCEEGFYRISYKSSKNIHKIFSQIF